MPSKPPTHDAILRAQHPERYAAVKSREDNARRATDETSAASKAMYASARWQRLRRIQLNAFPLCQCDDCRAADRTLAATDVDHIVPIRDGGACWDQANLMSLSHACHASKTARETAARRR